MYGVDYVVKKKSVGRPPIYTSKEDRIKNIYRFMVNTPWYCNICDPNHNYTLAGKHSHLQTEKHKRNSENIIN